MPDDYDNRPDGYDELRAELVRRQFDDRADDAVALLDRLERLLAGRVRVAREYLSHLLDTHVMKAAGRCIDDEAMVRQGEQAAEALHIANDALADLDNIKGPAMYPDEIFDEAVDAAARPHSLSEMRRAIRRMVLDIGYPRRRAR